jgi:hypothetical protein
MAEARCRSEVDISPARAPLAILVVRIPAIHEEKHAESGTDHARAQMAEGFIRARAGNRFEVSIVLQRRIAFDIAIEWVPRFPITCCPSRRP